jgi:hypothetical protein
MTLRPQLHEATIPFSLISSDHGTSRQCNRSEDQTAVPKAAKPRSFIDFRIPYKALTSAGKQPQGIKKVHHKSPPRRSARLSRSIKVDKALDGISQHPFPSPESDIKGVDVRYPFGL